MSEQYIHQFDFGIAPNAPEAVLRTFRAIAAGQDARLEDRAAFGLGAFLDRHMMVGGQTCHGAPLVLWETGVINNPDNPHHAPMPEWGVRFSFVMHDDHFNNGGYILPFTAFDLIGAHGLFCVAFDETNRTTLTLYFKEFDDLIVQTVAAPPMAYPLPPAAANNRKRYLRGWNPAAECNFKLEGFTRIGPDERKRLIAEADDMMGPSEE